MITHKYLSRTCTKLLHLLLLLLTLNGYGQSKPRILIITGNGNAKPHDNQYPPWIHEFQNATVASILKENMDVDIDIQEDLRILNTNSLRPYSLIISNSIFLSPTSDQLQAVHTFVSEGKPFLTLHAGILSFLNWDRYAEFNGGLFIGGPSNEPETFKVYTRNTELWGYEYQFRDKAQHPVSQVVEDFYTKDELYYFQPITKDFHVIARAENHPIMWWHPYYKGKVMNLSLGHDEEAKNNQGYQELLSNGVRWLLGIPLLKTEPLNSNIVSVRQLKYDGFMTMQPLSKSDKSINTTYEVRNEDAAGLFKVYCDQNGKLDLQLTGKTGEGNFTVIARTANALIGKRTFNLKIAKDGVGNIARYFDNTVEATSTENASEVFKAAYVLDDDRSTKWSSANVQEASISIDLKKPYTISKLILHWDGSYAARYAISHSQDGKQWSEIVHVENSDGNEDVITFPALDTRFIRIDAIKRAPGQWGYAINDIEIYK